MEVYDDIHLRSISVIVEKHEHSDFCFYCPKRLGDGFIFILSGSGMFHCCQGSFPLKQGDLLLVQKGDSYTVEAGPRELSYITTLFETEQKNAFRAFNLPFYIQTANYPHIETNIKKLLDIWEKRPVLYFAKARIMIEQLLVNLTDIANAPLEGAYGRLTPAITYITSHYATPLTNEKLANLCGLSITHFRRLFREEFGITPLQYREDIRIHWAIKLLESQMFTTVQIAERLGYADIYHFSKAVKRHTGFSPSHYQKSTDNIPV